MASMTDGCKDYVDPRRWKALADAKRESVRAMTPEKRFARSAELSEFMRQAIPGWPDQALRDADLASHLRVCALLARFDDRRR